MRRSYGISRSQLLYRCTVTDMAGMFSVDITCLMRSGTKHFSMFQMSSPDISGEIEYEKHHCPVHMLYNDQDGDLCWFCSSDVPHGKKGGYNRKNTTLCILCCPPAPTLHCSQSTTSRMLILLVWEQECWKEEQNVSISSNPYIGHKVLRLCV